MDKNEKKEEISCEVLPDDYSQYDYSFKIIVIGDSGVGKSCLTMKATKDLFENHYSATVGFEFFTFNSKLNDKILKLQIWDTCGQEIYRSLIANFYRNSSLAIMVYSVENRQSFTNLEIWLKDLKTMANPDAKVFIIGNKVDLNDKREVTFEEGQKFCEDNGLDYFCETSAKTGFNTKNVFIEASIILYKESLKYKDTISRSSSIVQDSSLNPYNPNLKIPLNTQRLDIENAKEKKNKKCSC